MPKRSTLAFSSEDAMNKQQQQQRLRTLYCQSCSDSVLITNADWKHLPRRKRDNAIMIDRAKYVVKLKARKRAQNVLVKRKDGSIEKQVRYYCGDVPVCYECNDDEKVLYAFAGAIGNLRESVTAMNDEVDDEPVPPCFKEFGSSDGDDDKGELGVAITVAVDYDEERTMIKSIDGVALKLALSGSVSNTGTSNAQLNNDKIADFLTNILKCRRTQIEIIDDDCDDDDDDDVTTKKITLKIASSNARACFVKLKRAMESERQKIRKIQESFEATTTAK
jgi:hypothetical protein